MAKKYRAKLYVNFRVRGNKRAFANYFFYGTETKKEIADQLRMMKFDIENNIKK